MIKKDINLVPVKKKLPSSITIGIPVGVLLFALLLTIGIYLPSSILKSKEAKLSSLETELNGYADTETLYQQKLKELSTLQENKKNYENFISSGRETLDMVKALNAITPDTVTILQYGFDIDNIIISGFTKTDLGIADFEDILWKTKMFKDIGLGTISGEKDKRLFIFTLTHIDSEAGGANK